MSGGVVWVVVASRLLCLVALVGLPWRLGSRVGWGASLVAEAPRLTCLVALVGLSWRQGSHVLWCWLGCRGTKAHMSSRVGWDAVAVRLILLPGTASRVEG